mmetsp:Transcript_72222/g.145308  ORF Transcript_72222/g.145308 Transcript_72222/m.145308 type:complete len:198 (+) Transcript_72222:356-949(+)
MSFGLLQRARQHVLRRGCCFQASRKGFGHSSSLPEKTLTPLQQAALDAREQEIQRRRDDLALRVRNSEENEHVEAPSSTVESAIEVIADTRIRKAMAEGAFDCLGHRKGQLLDPRRAVGDIEANAGVAPPWVEKQKNLAAAVEAAGRTAGNGQHISDEDFLALQVMQREYNRGCPPQFQQPALTREFLFRFRGERET